MRSRDVPVKVELGGYWLVHLVLFAMLSMSFFDMVPITSTL